MGYRAERAVAPAPNVAAAPLPSGIGQKGHEKTPASRPGSDRWGPDGRLGRLPALGPDGRLSRLPPPSRSGARVLEAAQQVLFAHLVETGCRRRRRSLAAPPRRRPASSTAAARSRLRLVDLDVFLQRVDQLLLEVVRRDGLVGDLTQGHDRVLVAVASMVRGAPEESRRARWPARSTSSKRFSTLSMQSSTVTRAMRDPFLGQTKISE